MPPTVDHECALTAVVKDQQKLEAVIALAQKQQREIEQPARSRSA